MHVGCTRTLPERVISVYRSNRSCNSISHVAPSHFERGGGHPLFYVKRGKPVSLLHVSPGNLLRNERWIPSSIETRLAEAVNCLVIENGGDPLFLGLMWSFSPCLDNAGYTG